MCCEGRISAELEEETRFLLARPALLPTGSAGCGRQSADCSPLACLRQALERKLCKETAFVAADVAGLSANWFDASRRSRATGFAGRAARSAAPLPCLCSARELSLRHRPNWRKLLVLRPEAGSPVEVQEAKSPGEELESEELSNVLFAALNFPFASWFIERE